jgi:hypothetical protein
MGPNDIIELLKLLSEKTRSYEAAKNELNVIQKQLHGTPYLFSRNGPTKNGPLGQKQDQAGPPRVKRGRGRPKKIKNDIKTTLDQDETGTENENKTENMIEINRIGDDAFSSCETYCSDTHDTREEECCEDDTRPDFKDAVYAFIADNIYIETRYGNYYDINTLELRGWYNPYTGKQEGLL